MSIQWWDPCIQREFINVSYFCAKGASSVYKESHRPPWQISILQSRAWELAGAEHHCQMSVFRPTKALTPYGKGAKLASQSSELVGVTASFEMAQALFQNQFLLHICCSRGGLLEKHNTKQQQQQQHIHVRTHITPKDSMQMCTQHTCSLNTIKHTHTHIHTTHTHRSFLLGVHFDLEEIPDLWYAKANLYVFYSESFPDHGLLWDSEIQWSLSPGQSLAAGTIQQVNHQVALYECMSLLARLGGTVR